MSSDYKRLKEIARVGLEASKNLVPQIDGFNETLAILKKNVPDDQKGMVEKLQAKFSQSIALSKKGKYEEANKILKDLQNECKNN